MITLRQDISLDDALCIADWLEDEDVLRYLNEDLGISHSIRNLVLTTRMPLYNQTFNNRGPFYLICHDNAPIGYVKFIQKSGFHEIVITIGDKSLWGKGFGKRALNLALQEAFFTHRFNTVNAKIKTENHRSVNLFEHVGFLPLDPYADNLHFTMSMTTYLKKAA